MRILMRDTYLLDVEKIKADLDGLWADYQKILDNPDWVSLNEARAILYLVGQLYCEKIVPEAIERRLHLLKKPASLDEFLLLVDSKSAKLVSLRKDPIFAKLEKFYLAVKNFKNKFVGGKLYLDEEKFNELYNKYNPDKKSKMGYRGNFQS